MYSGLERLFVLPLTTARGAVSVGKAPKKYEQINHKIATQQWNPLVQCVQASKKRSHHIHKINGGTCATSSNQMSWCSPPNTLETIQTERRLVGHITTQHKINWAQQSSITTLYQVKACVQYCAGWQTVTKVAPKMEGSGRTEQQIQDKKQLLKNTRKNIQKMKWYSTKGFVIRYCKDMALHRDIMTMLSLSKESQKCR